MAMASLLARLLMHQQGHSELVEDIRVWKDRLAGYFDKTSSQADPPTKHHRPRHRSGLKGLPTKVLSLIAAYTSPIDQASLALVSRTELHKLGRASLQLQGKARLSLLTRLERDGVRPADVLCPQCQVFHAPDLSLPLGWYFENGTAFRPCAQFHTRAASSQTLPKGHIISAFLPLRLHFNMIAGVMRCHRHGWSTHPVETLSSTSRYDYSVHSRYPKVFSTTRCKIVNGRLLAKTEKLIYLCKNLADLRNAFTKVRLLFKRDWALHHVCGHFVWTESYPRNLKSPNGRIWRNSPISEESPSLRPGLHRVVGCAWCYTDCALSAYDLPNNGGRVISLTTWKDLGYGRSIKDSRWRSHLHPVGPISTVTRVVNVSELGLVAEAFEAASTGKPADPYHPSIDAATSQYLMADGPSKAHQPLASQPRRPWASTLARF